MSIIPGSAARIEMAPACAPVPTPALTPVVLTDGYAYLTDGDACTSVRVDADAWEDGADRIPGDGVEADWDGWLPAEGGLLRDTAESTADAGDLREIADREGPCVVVRLAAETWGDDGEVGEILGTVLAVQPLTVAAARRRVTEPGERGWTLCPACAARVEGGEDVPGLGAAAPVARACSTTDGVCDACAAEAEGPWDGYGLYTAVV